LRLVANQTIDMSEPLWRYFKTERIVNFLETGNLYFSSARQFQDPFEGAVAVLRQDFQLIPDIPNSMVTIEHSSSCAG